MYVSNEELITIHELNEIHISTFTALMKVNTKIKN